MYSKKYKTSLDINEIMINTVRVIQALISKDLIMLILSKAKIYQLCKYNWKTK